MDTRLFYHGSPPNVLIRQRKTALNERVTGDLRNGSSDYQHVREGTNKIITLRWTSYNHPTGPVLIPPEHANMSRD